VLALVADPGLRGEIDQIAAAAGIRVVHAEEPPSRRMVWTGASAVLVDVAAARRCRDLGLPRRQHVVLVLSEKPEADEFEVAIAVGAQRVITLLGQETELVSLLSEIADPASGARNAPVVAVIGGRGGGGATVFSVVLAQVAAQASGASLLVDADPWGGGIDLVLGVEQDSGLRWPDLAVQGGRLNYSALRDALPTRRGVSVLSLGRRGAEVDAGALAAVVDAGSRAGTTVICDLPRQASVVAEAALAAADLVAVVCPADVRSCAATGAVAGWVAGVNPNVGLVVRGPAPGGLRASEMATILGLPLLAAMRAEARLAAALEEGGLQPGGRSPLVAAARRVLGALRQQSGAAA
jgi:secretion/DNA translocation related CpaE-like protein